MSNYPILMSSAMVRAILASRKSQTRRIFKGIWPKVKSGDLLWIRETWAVDAPLEQVRRQIEDAMPSHGNGPFFRADGFHEDSGLRWRPSIHMPRWASRLTLRVTEVRRQQLQRISEADAIAEGLICQEGDVGTDRMPGYCWSGMGFHGGTLDQHGSLCFHTPRRDRKKGCSCNVRGPSPAQCAFRELWDRINGARARWASNPDVSALGFEAVKANVDEVGRAR